MKYLFIILTVLSISCKKDNITISQADLLGNWRIDSVFTNNHTSVYPTLRVVVFQSDGIYTVSGNRFAYEVIGDKIKLKHNHSYTLSGNRQNIVIGTYIENPVQPPGTSKSYLTRN